MINKCVLFQTNKRTNKQTIAEEGGGENEEGEEGRLLRAEGKKGGDNGLKGKKYLWHLQGSFHIRFITGRTH